MNVNATNKTFERKASSFKVNEEDKKEIQDLQHEKIPEDNIEEVNQDDEDNCNIQIPDECDDEGEVRIIIYFLSHNIITFFYSIKLNYSLAIWT